MSKRISLDEGAKRSIQNNPSLNPSNCFVLFNVTVNQFVSSNDSNPIITNCSSDNSFIISMNNSNSISNPQKFLNAVMLNYSSKKISQKNPFSPEEDNLISYLVKSYGENNWAKISKCMKQMNYDRNIRQCKERYNHYLNPKINNSEWTTDEDELLIKKVEQIGKRWKILEDYFQGRTEVSLRNRFNMLIRKREKCDNKKERKINIMSSNFSFLDDYYGKKRDTSKFQEKKTHISENEFQNAEDMKLDFFESLDENIDIHMNDDSYFY